MTLKTLLAKIATRPEYKDHTVLDGCKLVVLVTTKNSLWFLHNNNKWEEVTPTRAEELCNNYYFSNRFNAMNKD